MLTSKCPICKKPTVTDFRPFCSKRCKDIDLAHWLRGDYHIPGEEKKDDKKSNNDKEEEQNPLNINSLSFSERFLT